MKIAYKPEKL